MRKIVSLVLCLLITLVTMPFYFATASALSVSAKSAILINANTLSVLYEKNANQRLAMASTTKIMTALLLCEAGNLDREVLVTKDMVAVEGSSMGLTAGVSVSRRDLLYGMMLSSGNDAAGAAAVAVSGSVQNFVLLMNERATSLGLKDTHFETPSGLDGDNHYTTASDLAKLAAAALKNQDFLQACSSKTAAVYLSGVKHTLINHNRLLKNYDGLIGVKTGFTKKAGRCLVTAAKRNGVTLVAVTLSAPDDWNDHRALLDMGFSTVNKINLSDCTDDFNLSVVGSNVRYSRAVLDNCEVFLPENEKDDIKVDVFLPSFVYAPIFDGECVGSAVFSINGNELARTDIRLTVDAPALKIKNSFLRRYVLNLIYLLKGF